MSYQSTVDQLRAAAQVVNPDKTFISGRQVDFSQEFDGKFPAIHLAPFTITEATEALDSQDLLVGFWMQDAPDSNVDDREDIVRQMELMCRAFLAQLRTDNRIDIKGVVMEPQFQMYNGTVSGFATKFTYYNLPPC